MGRPYGSPGHCMADGSRRMAGGIAKKINAASQIQRSNQKKHLKYKGNIFFQEPLLLRQNFDDYLYDTK